MNDVITPAGEVRPRGRLAGIEGLRAMAALAVVVHHVWILGGRVGAGSRAETIFLNFALGVTLFFALSGFLLYRPFAAAIARDEKLPGIRDYLRNRALRILPAYLVILALTAWVLQTAGTRDDQGLIHFGAMTDPVEVIKTALLIQDYMPNSMVTGIGPAWSLAVEVVFYLTLPLMVLGVARLAIGTATRNRRLLILLLPPLALLLIGLSGKFVAGVLVPGSPAAGYSSDWHSVVERSFWAQADLFSFGMIAAILHTEVSDGRLRLPRHWRPVCGSLAIAIFAACALSLGSGQLSYLPQNTVVALAAAMLLAVVTFPNPQGGTPVVRRVLEWRWIVFAGLISYSVFLWNEPLLRWLADRGITASNWAEFALLLALTVLIVGALSYITYRLVELPALRRKRRQPDPAQLEAAP